MNLEFPKVDLSGVNDSLKKIEKVLKTVREEKDNAMAMEFTRVICDLLKENGVTVQITEIEEENHATNKFEVKYGFAFTGLDFSKHDKKVAEEKDKKIAELEEDLNRLTMDLKNRMGQIHELKEKNEELDRMRKRWLDTAVKLSDERFDLKRQIEMLETNGNESCKDEPVSDCCRPSIEWYEDRHQSDCVRINQLLTTIDVLTERYQKLREVHGL